MAKVLFSESQYLKKAHFTSVILMFFLCSFVLFVCSMFQFYSFINPVFPERLNLVFFRITEVTSIFLFYFLLTGYFIKMETRVTEKGVKFRYFPFKLDQLILRENIKNFEVVNDKNIMTYGGWSVRRAFGRQKGIYVVSGKIGVRLTLIDGRKLVLGSQKPKTFMMGLKRMEKFK